jgi:hypothetical protein
MNRYDCPDPLGELLFQMQNLGADDYALADLLVISASIITFTAFYIFEFTKQYGG